MISPSTRIRQGVQTLPEDQLLNSLSISLERIMSVIILLDDTTTADLYQTHGANSFSYWISRDY